MTDNYVAPVLAHLLAPEKFGTQTRLAQAAGVQQHTISGKRKSKNPLTYQQMQRILEAAPAMGVSVSPEDFFPETDRATQEAA